MSKVYVYKEYCDDDAYGEEIIEVYADKEKARSQLLERMAGAFYYDGPLSKANLSQFLASEGILGEDDDFTSDYASISCGKGVCYWVIEEKEVL